MPRCSDQLPEFLRLSPEAEWERLMETFHSDAYIIQHVRLEEADEAIKRRSPTEKDALDEELPETKHSLLIPHRRTDDAAELETCLAYAHALIPELETLFKAREITPQFLRSWGAFQYAVGYVASVHAALGDDLGPDRAGIAGAQVKSRKAQRKWVSHLLLRQIRAGRERQLAERDVARAIKTMLDDGSVPQGSDAEWFDMLGGNNQLKSTYTRKHLSRAEMEALEKLDIPIPSIEIPISKT